jgi:hydroxyacylglutathione hydrolase
VDPGESKPIINALSTLPCTLSLVLCTHKHADHAGGNEAIKAAFPNIEVMATQYEPIPGITKPVAEGVHFRLGNLDINVIYTPCHTRGHVIFIISGSSGIPIIFSGDTLFVGGTGRFFEGTADEMLINMDRLATYAPESLVYPAHEYTESNFKFLSHVDPETCGERYKWIQKIRAEGLPTVPTTISEEIEFNLFMHCRRERLMKLLDCPTPVETMAKLRQMKNNF